MDVAEYSFMENLIRLVEAMGFWGWIAVIVCTAIIADKVAEVKKARYKHYEKMAKNEQGISEDSTQENQDGTKVEVNKKGVYVKDGDEEVKVSWKGVEVRDGTTHVKVPMWWAPIGILGIIGLFLFLPGLLFYFIFM